MGKIYCVMGKSSSGKDSIYSRIMQQGNPALLRIVPYTTRPRREGETDGREYVFTDEAHVQQLESAGKVIELRAYHTVYGIWKYFTVDDGRIDLSAHSYLYIVTLEGYQKIQRYFGSSQVVPIYIEVEDHGKGIEDVKKAMEPLFTTKPEMDRSGMGFSFMEAFMDSLEVESTPGKGTLVKMSKIIGKGRKIWTTQSI